MPAAAHLITRMLALAFFAFSAIVAMPGEADARSDRNGMSDYRNNIADRDDAQAGTGDHDGDSDGCVQLGGVDGQQSLARSECSTGSSSSGGAPPPPPVKVDERCDRAGYFSTFHTTRRPSRYQGLTATLETPEYGHARGSIQPAELELSHDGVDSLRNCTSNCGNDDLILNVRLSGTLSVDAPAGYNHGNDVDWYFRSAGATSTTYSVGGRTGGSEDFSVEHYLASPADETPFEATPTGSVSVTAEREGYQNPRCRLYDVMSYGPDQFRGMRVDDHRYNNRDPREGTRPANYTIGSSNVNFNFVDDNDWTVLGSRSR